ncbi:alpha/beta hydrolase [Stenotrophomonas maltophilia]|uniref:alpha/beta hydrolase n=1 Tax=Stenotrophomonas maltophilia TaxID=40324 RepID=UPI0025EE8D97|nr:alpha/beta fold hydrolase [uncultured Stenotrophomonas sp.]
MLLAYLLWLTFPTWASEPDIEIPATARTACDMPFQRLVEKKIEQGVPSKHLPRLGFPENGPSDVTVILVHGLFESPYFLRGAGERLRAQGYNTLSILLSGQWGKDTVSARDVTFFQWLDELDRAMLIASCLGPRVVFAGHSLGATVALAGALKYPDYTAGLLLWAPALKLKLLPTVGGAIGVMTGLSGNVFLGKRPDLDETPYYSGNQANEARRLAKFIFARHAKNSRTGEEDHSGGEIYEEITAPTFLVVPMKDPAVQPEAAFSMYDGLSGEKMMIVYPQNSDVWHANVAKSELDAYKVSPKDFNKNFDEMMNQIEGFFNQKIDASGHRNNPLRELDEPLPAR